MNIDFGFVTCAELRDLYPDDRLLLNILRNKGYKCRALVWDDPNIDWDLVRISILRSAWDYHLKYDMFLKWLNLVSDRTKLVNSAELACWNINKRYLQVIEKNGLPVIPTIYLENRQKVDILSIMKERDWQDIIVKPAIGLSAYGVKRIDGTKTSIIDGRQHVENLLENGDVLVQPYFHSVENYGERNLIFIAGEYSHCVRKMRFQATEKASDKLVEVNTVELVLARKILESISPQPFYARVDLLQDPDNQPCLVELELVDPNLFFSLHQPAVENFANGIIKLLEK